MPSPPPPRTAAGPKATPLAHEGKVFTLGISGILAAFDVPDRHAALAHGGAGRAALLQRSLVAVGVPGLVIVHPGNYEALTAFDVSSGAVRWKTGGGRPFMSPTLVTLQGVQKLVSVTQAGVMSVSPSNGAMLW